MAITVKKSVTVDKRYIEFLKITSSFLNLELSDREMEVLNELYWSSEGVLTTAARQEVAKKLDISEFNLNNQIGKLRKKKLISKGKNAEHETILQTLMPDLEVDKNDLPIVFLMTSA